MNENDEGFFRIPYQRIARDDIRQRLGKDKTQLSDAALSDEFMQEVANKMGGSLVDEGWWETLELAVEVVCDTLDIDFEGGTMCSYCGSYDTEWRSISTYESQNLKTKTDTFYCKTCDRNFDAEVLSGG